MNLLTYRTFDPLFAAKEVKFSDVVVFWHRSLAPHFFGLVVSARFRIGITNCNNVLAVWGSGPGI